MVTRSVKYSLAILGVLVVALLVAPFFIDVESYKSEISSAVEDATGRKMEIGNIEASLFPWVGVRLEDVHLANRAGFSDHDFLKIESLDVQVALLPLLSDEVEIKQFKLVAPELFMERNKEGAGNWEDLSGAETAADGVESNTGEKPADNSATEGLTALTAESLQLTHGRLIWIDGTNDSRVELNEVNVAFSDVQLERPVQVTASAMLGEDSIEMDAQVGPLGDIAKLNVGKLPVQATLKSESLALKPLAGIIPELPQAAGNIDSARLHLDVQLEQRPDGIRLSAGNIAFLGALTAEGKWKAEMSDSKSVRLQQVDFGINGQLLFNAKGELLLGNKLKYQLRVEGGAIKRSWLATLFPQLESMYAAHPAPWQQVKVGALIAGDSERLELRDMQLMLDQDRAQASGVVTFGKTPDIRLRLSASQLHMDAWLPQPKEQKKAAASVQSELANVSASANSDEPDLRAFTGLRISSQMQIETLHLHGLKLEHLRATVNGNRGVFKLEPLRFDLSGGQVTENASLNLAVYPAKWTESAHVVGVSVGPVLRALADVDMLEGVLQMDSDLKATGLLPETSMKSLNGKGKLLLRDGSVKGFDIAGTLRNLAAPKQTRGSEKTDFAQLQGSFTITDGMVKNSDLFMASPVFRLTGNGTVNLPRGILDYHVKPKLVGTLVGQGDTVTVRKGLTVPLHIRGPFATLRVTPEIDPASLIENIDVLKGGNPLKGLKEAIGGGKPAQQQKPADAAPPTPEEQLRKALGGMLKR